MLTISRSWCWLWLFSSFALISCVSDDPDAGFLEAESSLTSGSAPFSVSNTNFATQNSFSVTIPLKQDQLLTFGVCLIPGTSVQGQTYARVSVYGATRAVNVNGCGNGGSLLRHRASFDGDYTFVIGCNSVEGACSGVVAWGIEVPKQCNLTLTGSCPGAPTLQFPFSEPITDDGLACERRSAALARTCQPPSDSFVTSSIETTFGRVGRFTPWTMQGCLVTRNECPSQPSLTGQTTAEFLRGASSDPLRCYEWGLSLAMRCGGTGAGNSVTASYFSDYRSRSLTLRNLCLSGSCDGLVEPRCRSNNGVKSTFLPVTVRGEPSFTVRLSDGQCPGNLVADVTNDRYVPFSSTVARAVTAWVEVEGLGVLAQTKVDGTARWSETVLSKIGYYDGASRVRGCATVAAQGNHPRRTACTPWI